MITRPEAMSTTAPPEADKLSWLEMLFVASALLAPLNLHVVKALTLYDAVTVMIALVVLVGPGRMRASPSSLRIAAALLLMAGLVGVFRSTYPIESGLQVVQYAFVFFVQIPVILTLGRSRPAVQGALLVLIAGYALVMVVAFFSQQVQLAGRVVPFFNENPNALAIPTIILVPFVLFFSVDRWRVGQRFAVLVAGGSVLYLMLWSLAASASRGSTISTVVSLTVFVALRDGWDRTAKVLMRAATMIVALVVIGVVIHSTSVFPDTLRSRIEGTLSPSDEGQAVADERVALDRSGVRAFLASPLVGTGFDNFRYVAQFYDDEATFHEPHNLWIQFLAQTGIVGAGAFLFIIARWFALLVRAQRQATDRSDRHLLWAFIAAMSGLMVHAMVAPLILQRQYWLLYGLGIATAVGVARRAGPLRAQHDGQLQGTPGDPLGGASMPSPVEVGDRASSTGRFSSWMGSGSLTKRASLTSVASSLDHIAGLGVQFVINPLLVHGLGSYLYGVWRVLYSLNGYLWAASGRSAQVLTWVVANGQRTLSDEQKRRYVGSAVVVWFIFLPVLALVGGLGAWFAPVLLKTPQEYVWGVRAAAALLAADAIALTLLSIPRSALQGENLGYKRMGSSALLIVVGGVFMLIAIGLDAGIAGVALANALGTIATGLLFLQVARTHVGWFGVERPSRKDVRWFLGLSGWFTAWKFVYEILTAGDVIVLAIFGRVELVTVYTLTKFVSQALVPLIAVVFEGSSPGLGAIIGGGDHPKGIRLRNELMALSWLLCTGLGAALLIWNRSFVGLWVGSEFYAGADVMLLIVVMIMQFVFIGNDARIIDLTLKVRAKVVLGAASAGLSLALAAIFVVVFEDQILGMCAGVIVGRTVLSVAYPSLIGRLLGYRMADQLRAVPRPASVTVIVFGAAMLLGTRVSTGSWVALVAFGATTALAASVFAAALGLTGAQRRTLLARFAHLTGRGRGPGGPGGRAREAAS